MRTVHDPDAGDARGRRRARRRLVLLSAPPAREGRGAERDVRVPEARAGHRPPGAARHWRSIWSGRSSSATSCPTSAWRAASARAACSCAPGTARASCGPGPASCPRPRRLPAISWRRPRGSSPNTAARSPAHDRRGAPAARGARPVSARARGRGRRPGGRRVHLRPDRPRLARGAGADPRLRLDRDRAGRRRQRGAATPRRSGHGWRSSASRGATPPAGRLVQALGRHVKTGGVVRSVGYDDARQDADPRRRRAFGQAAGRAHRSRRRHASTPAVARRVEAALRARHRAGRTPCSSPTTAPGLITPALWARVRAAAPATPHAARARRLTLRARRLLGHDGLHAERVGGRGSRRPPHRRRPRGARAGRAHAARAPGQPCRAHHPRQPRDGALRAGPSRPTTSRSSARTR